MNIWHQIIGNQPLAASLLAWFLAQFLKVLGSFKDGFNKEDLKKFVATGGFPSSHSAAVAALATSCGLVFGLDSAFFAIAAVLAVIVIYDAFTLRREAGRQAQVLNHIIDDFYNNKGIQFRRLKELIGHSRIEAFFGLILGILTAIVLFKNI
ncbi:MAG: divergent PAP2 family protein [Candidatus Paceibacterota bacterium]|jgi:hypothetical protein|nr:divergent PAP2 family protein [Candidatus Paceibacterota bacterium]MDD4830714.1 divergent PAP2 family protein [Candidatus Paceibacterota bacterium]MDD4875136.1 divergent PAP2 family protein [Candidatus Paceibacterota bacterium]